MKKNLIYLITDGTATVENFSAASAEILKIIRAAAESNIPLIQIREKNLTAKLIFKLTAEAVKLTRETSVKILVNDRADIALAAKADGVHLSSQSLAAKIIRQNFPKDFIVGVSAHSFEEAKSAHEQGANFATFSPIFKTPSKEKYGEPQGLQKLCEVCRRLKPFPIIALGGIDENNYTKVLENGASGFAAIRFLNDVDNIRKLKI